MEVENIPVVEVVPYDKNPRKNDKAVDIVAKSIQEFGFQQPLVLDKNNVIIAGHTRLKAAIKLGLSEVPVVWADKLTKEQVQAFRLMENKTHEMASWDAGLLKSEMLELQNLETDLSLTGFNEKEIEKIIAGLDFSNINDEGFGDANLNESQIRMVQLFFNLTKYEEFGQKVNDLGKFYKTDNITDTIWEAINEIHKIKSGNE